MEYLIGATIAIVSYMVAQRFVRSSFEKEKPALLRYSQTHIYEIVKPYLEFSYLSVAPENTQATNYLKEAYMKVMIVKNKAYWIKDNTFFTADVANGQVQKETAKEVDTMSMNKVELNEMLFIVEKLREESDDNRSSGK